MKCFKAKKAKGLHEVEAGEETGGFGFLCQLCGDGANIEEVRRDRSNRSITFRVDSGACKTVINPDHPAARGYRIWDDPDTGKLYRTAGKSGVKDEGKRILQTKATGGPHGQPQMLKTRV